MAHSQNECAPLDDQSQGGRNDAIIRGDYTRNGHARPVPEDMLEGLLSQGTFSTCCCDRLSLESSADANLGDGGHDA